MATSAHRKGSLGECSTALVRSTAPNPLSFNTHVPFVGTIDLENPLEIAIWGAAGASVLLAPGWWKLAIPVALIALRYQMGKINT
jgi:hypothetical protein